MLRSGRHEQPAGGLARAPARRMRLDPLLKSERVTLVFEAIGDDDPTKNRCSSQHLLPNSKGGQRQRLFWPRLVVEKGKQAWLVPVCWSQGRHGPNDLARTSDQLGRLCRRLMGPKTWACAAVPCEYAASSFTDYAVNVGPSQSPRRSNASFSPAGQRYTSSSLR